MKPTEDLYELIHSMTMSEKRHFAIQSATAFKSGESAYLNMFYAIDKQKSYNEDALKKKLNSKQLAYEKNYLKNNLLQTLNEYHREKSVLIKIYGLLTSIEICYSKGLFTLCEKLITKAKALAFDFEKLSMALPLIRWQQLLLLSRGQLQETEALHKEEQKILATLSLQSKLVNAAVQIKHNADKGIATSSWLDKEEKRLRSLMKSQQKKIRSGFLTHYYFYTALGLISSQQGNHSKRMACYQYINELFMQKPLIIRDISNIYLSNYNNLVNAALALFRTEEALDLIHKQRRFFYEYRSHNPQLAHIVLINTYENELFLYYRSGDFKRAGDVTAEAEKILKNKSNPSQPEEMDLLLALASAHFLNKNYRMALRSVNKILSASKEQSLVRKEILFTAILLFLIILTESEDITFNNRLRYYMAQLKKENAPQEIQLMTELIQQAGAKQQTRKMENYARLILQLKEVSAEHEKQSLNKLFDVPLWIFAAFNKSDVRKLYKDGKGGKGLTLLTESV